MNIDTDKILSKWKIAGAILAVLIPVAKYGIWPTFDFVRDTLESNEAVPRLEAAIDSLRLEIYATRLLQQGRALEYNPRRYLDSIKALETK